MEDKKYAVIAIKYLFDMKNMRTVKKFEVIDVLDDSNKAYLVALGCKLMLDTMEGKPDEEGRMLTSFSIEIKEFDRKFELVDIQGWVQENCSYEWGMNWKGESTVLKK